jgi:hypothetical protein
MNCIPHRQLPIQLISFQFVGFKIFWFLLTMVHSIQNIDELLLKRGILMALNIPPIIGLIYISLLSR